MQPLYEYLYSRRKCIIPYAEQLEMYQKMRTREKQSTKIIWTDDPKLENLNTSITFYEENKLENSEK
jgi:hypothetical protein